MICPLKFKSETLNADGGLYNNTCQCEQADCEWWVEYFGKCARAVDAYLKGREYQGKEGI